MSEVAPGAPAALASESAHDAGSVAITAGDLTVAAWRFVALHHLLLLPFSLAWGVGLLGAREEDFEWVGRRSLVEGLARAVAAWALLSLSVAAGRRVARAVGAAAGATPRATTAVALPALLAWALAIGILSLGATLHDLAYGDPRPDATFAVDSLDPWLRRWPPQVAALAVLAFLVTRPGAKTRGVPSDGTSAPVAVHAALETSIAVLGVFWLVQAGGSELIYWAWELRNASGFHPLGPAFGLALSLAVVLVALLALRHASWIARAFVRRVPAVSSLRPLWPAARTLEAWGLGLVGALALQRLLAILIGSAAAGPTQSAPDAPTALLLGALAAAGLIGPARLLRALRGGRSPPSGGRMPGGGETTERVRRTAIGVLGAWFVASALLQVEGLVRASWNGVSPGMATGLWAPLVVTLAGGALALRPAWRHRRGAEGLCAAGLGVLAAVLCLDMVPSLARWLDGLWLEPDTQFGEIDVGASGPLALQVALVVGALWLRRRFLRSRSDLAAVFA